MNDKQPEDPGDLLEVPEEEQLDADPTEDSEDFAEHAATGDGGPDDLSDAPEGDDGEIDESELQE